MPSQQVFGVPQVGEDAEPMACQVVGVSSVVHVLDVIWGVHRCVSQEWNCGTGPFSSLFSSSRDKMEPLFFYKFGDVRM